MTASSLSAAQWQRRQQLTQALIKLYGNNSNSNISPAEIALVDWLVASATQADTGKAAVVAENQESCIAAVAADHKQQQQPEPHPPAAKKARRAVLLSAQARRQVQHGTAADAPGSFAIFYKNFAGRSVCLCVRGSDTLSSLEDRIAALEGVPLGVQCLVYGGKQLQQSDKTLADYGISKDANLHLVYRAHGSGGGDME